MNVYEPSNSRDWGDLAINCYDTVIVHLFGHHCRPTGSRTLHVSHSHLNMNFSVLRIFKSVGESLGHGGVHISLLEV